MFLQRIIETHKYRKDNPVFMYLSEGNVTISINGETWTELTLDMCVESIKQSFAIRYLDEMERENKTEK
jgi:hypothetical protein